MWLCLTLFICCEMNILNSLKIISSKFNYGVFISYYDTFFVITQKPRSHAHGIKSVMKCPSSFCSNLFFGETEFEKRFHLLSQREKIEKERSGKQHTNWTSY